MRTVSFINVVLFFFATTSGAVDVVFNDASSREAKELRRIIKGSMTPDSMATLLRTRSASERRSRESQHLRDDSEHPQTGLLRVY